METPAWDANNLRFGSESVIAVFALHRRDTLPLHGMGDDHDRTIYAFGRCSTGRLDLLERMPIVDHDRSPAEGIEPLPSTGHEGVARRALSKR